MRPRPRVEDQPVGHPLQAMEVLDEVALVVGLEEPHLEVELAAELADPRFELLERQIAVVGGRATAQDVEVDAVHDLDAIPHAANSCTALARSGSGTEWPGVTLPTASTRTNGTSAPVRFLSSRVAATTAAGSACSSRAGRP